MSNQPRDRKERVDKADGPSRERRVPGPLTGQMTWADAKALLTTLAERLDPSQPVELIVAGGIALTAAGLRDMTADVDVVSELPADVLAFSIEIAKEKNLSEHWMNAHARAFVPSGATAQPIFEHGPLTILAVAPDDLFIMKIDAARPRDISDLRALWPLCSYESGEQASADYEARTPLAPVEHDPHLADWIDSIIAQ